MSEYDFKDAVAKGAEAVDSGADRVGEDVKAKAGATQAVIGDIADKLTASISDVGDKASATITKLGGQVIDAYDHASVSAKKMGETIEPLVQERPYAVLGVAALVGAVAGLLLWGRGPRIVYVRPPR